MSKNIIDTLKKLSNPLIAIFLSLLLGVLLIIPTGESPLAVYKMLLVGSFGSKTSLYGTFAAATPLLFTGLAAAMSFRAGVFNIGLEGQLYMGAMASTLCGIYFSFLPSFIYSFTIMFNCSFNCRSNLGVYTSYIKCKVGRKYIY
jgi:simple sugar transport system permease protein